MSSNAENALEIFKQRVGKEDGAGEWMTIDQDLINKFADCTHDHQFIHVDPERAAQLSPYGTTIAHGFLTLSLLTHLNGSVPNKTPDAYKGVVAGVNYGFDKVRFISPVKVNSKIRARRELVDAELKGNTVQLKQKVTVEIDGEDKPACVAEWLTRVVYG